MGAFNFNLSEGYTTAPAIYTPERTYLWLERRISGRRKWSSPSAGSCGSGDGSHSTEVDADALVACQLRAAALWPPSDATGGQALNSFERHR